MKNVYLLVVLEIYSFFIVKNPFKQYDWVINDWLIKNVKEDSPEDKKIRVTFEIRIVNGRMKSNVDGIPSIVLNYFI